MIGTRAAERWSQATGMPSRYSVPVAAGAVGLALGGVGESADVAYHVDFGRDESLLTVPHALILAAVATLVLSALLALAMPGPVGPGSLRLGRRRLPAGGLIVLACTGVALAAFALDGTWHELFGEDLTLWSPTHLLLIGGPTLSILGFILLVREGASLGRPTRVARAAQVVLAGFLLGALTDLQGEFGFGVPQFRLLFHPLAVAVTAGFVLVLARVLLGRWGALKVLGVYYAVSILPLLAGLLEPDRTDNRMPLYLVAAVVVELVAARVPRPLELGALAGLGVGTVGLAAEWGWSHVWMPFPWGDELLPEAAVLGAVAATAAGVIGARVAIAFRGAKPAPPGPRARYAVASAGLALVVVLAIPLPRTGVDARATVEPYDTRDGSTRLRVSVEPPDAARSAEWFRVTAVHGGSTRQVDLRPTGGGTYLTDGRVPVDGERDVLVRLARGSSLSSIEAYSKSDDGHHEPVPLARRTERFEAEHALPPVGGWREDLQLAGYAVVALVAASWLFWIWRALARLEGAPLLPAAMRRHATRTA